MHVLLCAPQTVNTSLKTAQTKKWMQQLSSETTQEAKPYGSIQEPLKTVQFNHETEVLI